MDRFSAAEMEALLREVDKHVQAGTEAILIGGSAIGLRFDPSHSTTDLDLIKASAELVKLFEQASARLGMRVPIQNVAVASFPEDYEERLKQVHVNGVSNLRILSPERHDLAISKIARGLEHDLEAVCAIHQRTPLDVNSLVEQFEKTYVTGSRRLFELALLDVVERLWGADESRRVERRLADPR